MWSLQLPVLALAISFTQASPTELKYSRADNCGTQSVVDSVNAVKAGTTYPVQFCQFYTAGNRVKSPFTNVAVSAVQSACHCILAAAPSTTSAKATSTSQATGPSASAAVIKSVKGAYTDVAAFCSFYDYAQRAYSTIPGLSVAQVQGACKSILASSTISASSKAKKTSSSSSKGSIQASSTHKASSTSSHKPSSASTSPSAAVSAYLQAVNVPSNLDEGSVVGTPPGALNGPLGFDLSLYYSSPGWVQHNFTMDVSTGHLYDRSLAVGAGSPTSGALSVEAGNAAFTPLVCAVPDNGALLSCTVSYQGKNYSQFAFAAHASAGLYLLETGTTNSNFGTLDLQVIYEGVAAPSTTRSSSSSTTSATATATTGPLKGAAYLLAQNAGSYLSGNQALAMQTSTYSGNPDDPARPGLNFPYFEPFAIQYYTFNASTGYIYDTTSSSPSASTLVGAGSPDSNGILQIQVGNSAFVPLVCKYPDIGSLLKCTVKYNKVVYSQFTLTTCCDAALLGFAQNATLPSSGYQTVDWQVVPSSVPYTPGSGE